MSISVVLNQMIQLFGILALGYFLNKIGIFDDFLNKKVNVLILNVTLPALIMASLGSVSESTSNGDVIQTFIISIVVLTALPIISYFLVKLLRIPLKQRGLYMFMTVFSNIGFMGYPVIKAIFGSEAIFFASIFNMMFSLLVFTLGVVIINYGSESSKFKLNFKSILSPGIVSSVIAIIFFIFKIPIAPILHSSFDMVGSMTTPLAMLVIGSTLANINIKEVFTELRIYPFAIIRQLLLPMAAYPILNHFVSNPLILGVSLIVLSMPVANSAVLFAENYDRDFSLAAKSVFLTTLMSVGTIPLIASMFLIK